MTSRERTEALLFMAGTLLLMLGLQWMTRVMLLSVATVETYWWLELVGLAAGIALAGIGYFTAEPFGKVAMAWLLVTAGLIWGIGPLVTSPEQAKWLPLVPRGAAWAIETLGQGTLDVLLGRRDPAFWPPRTARASLAGVLLAVFALPLALRLTEAAARELRPSKRHRGGNRYRSTETVFGDADWGTWAAMRKTVSDPGGIVLGEDYDPRRNPTAFRTDDPKTWWKGGRSELITLRTSYISGHVLVVSGAGGGKSAGIVIPTCLTYRKPVVVVDPDGEILARTRAAREAMGHSVRVIKPGQGFDMLALLESQFNRSDMSYLHVAGIITEDERLHSDGLSDYFKTEATKVIAALLAHYCKEGVRSPLAEIVRLISLELPHFKAEIARIADAHDPSHFVQIYLGNYRDPEPRFFQSFQNTVGQALKWVPYPEYLAMYTSDPEGSEPLLGAKTDIFIQVTKSDMKENPTLVRLIIGSILYVADHRQGDDAPDERLVIVDEAAVVGRMKIFESIRDTARKKRLHLMMIFQSQGQIEHLYGRPGLQSWMNGVSARVFSGIEALDECRALSEIVGSYTADVDGESRSVSSKPGLFSGVSQSVSSSNSLREAKLISPDQIRTLPGDAALVLVKGQRPLVAGIAFWFRRAEWADAASGPNDGAPLSLRSHILGHGATVGATFRSRSRFEAALASSNGTTP
jgi:type IV secretion system protein VirD4